MVRRLTLPLPVTTKLSPAFASSALVRRLTALLAALGAVTFGVVLGLLITAAAIRSDSIATVRAGPWRLFTDAGTPGVNPYLRARAAHLGDVPLAAAQGLTAIARMDNAGSSLDGRCNYRVSGSIPPAQFWTLEVTDTAGQPFDNPAARQGFTSDAVLRDGDGRFALTLAPSAMPGNWLPLPGAGHIMLILRLYGTGVVSGATTTAGASGWPSIEALGCP